MIDVSTSLRASDLDRHFAVIILPNAGAVSSTTEFLFELFKFSKIQRQSAFFGIKLVIR